MSWKTLLDKRAARLHLVGVAGSGMSGLARILLQRGYRVSGSDLKRTREVERLRAEGLEFFEGHRAENLSNAELLAYSTAVSADNVERQTAQAVGLPMVRRAELLAAVSTAKKTLLVSGMHGKSTTTSMLAHVLRSAGLKPSHYVGAEVPTLGSSAQWDEGEHIIIEGDESDGTITEFEPEHLLILNLEEEHLDYYRDLDHILRVFRELMGRTRGKVVYCADDKNTLLLCSHRNDVVGFGLEPHAHYRAQNVQMESFGSSFEVTCGGRFLGRVRLEVPGIKNVSNATGVIALAMELGVPWEHIAPALAGFTGVTRRFEVKYKTADFMVVDDYAHHPTEIRATLAAARNAGWKRVVALFQPHRYSRTKFLLEDFASAFGDADAVFLTDVYAASEVPLDGIDGGTLADSVRAGGHALVHYESSLKALQHAVSQALRPGDLVVTLGAGNIHEVAARLSRELAHFEELVGLMRDGSKLLRQEPMSRHTTLRLGGPAELWFEPASVRDLTAALQWASRHHMAWTPIGRGSNLLVRDGGIAGLCVHLSHPSFSEVIVEGSTIRAGAGVRLKAIVQTAKKAGLGGLEFLEGIPGNLGGAIRMNAGAMQGWTMDVIESVTSVDAAGVEHTTRKEDLEIKYRSVPRYERELVLSAVLRGTPVAPGEIDERLKAYSNKRWNSQPAAPSAGCIFKNPGEEPAGRMIDVTGLKNLAVGAARVSEVHGNFIVNDGGATASDVLELIHLIQEKIRAQRGVELETEVIILGENA